MPEMKRARSVDWIMAGVRDDTGAANSGGTIKAFEHGTNVPRPLYQDRDRIVPWGGPGLNEVQLDAGGFPTAGVFGEGPYDFEVASGLPNPQLKYTLEDLEYRYDVVNVRDFGATGDGLSDDRAAIQAAIDFAITAGESRVYIPAGRYRILAPLLIVHPSTRPPVAGQGYALVGLEIYGDKVAFPKSGLPETVIFADIGSPPDEPGQGTNDAPAIIIQAGRGVSLRRLNIEGRNTIAEGITDASQLMDDHLFVVNGCRDNLFSPYAGIAVDPFMEGAPDGVAANRYPKLESFYVAETGSSGIVIDDCSILGFVAGIVVTPHGGSQNGAEMVIHNTVLRECRVGFATCGTQNKAIRLDHVHVVYSQFAFSNRSFGHPDADARGYPPTIRGGSVGLTKYAFNIQTSTGPFTADGLFMEATLSLGYLGHGSASTNTVASVTHCALNLVDTVDAGRWAIDTHLWSFGQVRFAGCQFGFGTNAQPLSFFNHGAVLFENCAFNNDDAGGSMRLGFHDWSEVRFENAKMRDATYVHGGYDVRSVHRLAALSAANRRVMHNGTRILLDETTPGTSGTWSLRCVAPPIKSFRIQGSTQHSLKPGVPSDPTRQGWAYIELTNPGTALEVLKEGDIVYRTVGSAGVLLPRGYPANTIYGSDGVVGMIHKVDSANQRIFLEYVPESLDFNSTYRLSVKYLARYHEPTTGNPSQNKTALTQVTPTGAWAVGDRIWGVGIEPGTYIKAINSPMKLELSTPATASGVGVRLYDADVKRIATVDD